MDVVLETRVTTAWSPVTVDHLCYFVDGMLSMPGGVGGLFNLFDVFAKPTLQRFKILFCLIKMELIRIVKLEYILGQIKVISKEQNQITHQLLVIEY